MEQTGATINSPHCYFVSQRALSQSEARKRKGVKWGKQKERSRMIRKKKKFCKNNRWGTSSPGKSFHINSRWKVSRGWRWETQGGLEKVTLIRLAWPTIIGVRKGKNHLCVGLFKVEGKKKGEAERRFVPPLLPQPSGSANRRSRKKINISACHPERVEQTQEDLEETNRGRGGGARKPRRFRRPVSLILQLCYVGRKGKSGSTLFAT